MPAAPQPRPPDGRGQGSIVVLLAVLALVAGVGYKAKDRLPAGILEYVQPRPLDVKPLDAPRMLDLPELTDKDYQDDMLWGSYRPGLYFGMRTRSPKSLLSGLMWFDPDHHDTLNKRKVRHHASQDDKLSTYGWQRHDGRSFGRQVLVDEGYNLTVSMVGGAVLSREQLKHRSEDSGTGGDWAVRVAVRRSRGGPRKRISLCMYLGDEAAPTWPSWKVMPEGESGALAEGVTLVTGGNAVVGPWSFHAQEHNKPAASSGSTSAQARPNVTSGSRLDYLALPTEGQSDYLLHVKELLLGIVYEQLERNPTSDKFQLYLPNGATTGSNLALFQVTFTIPSAVDFVFLSHKKGVDPSLVDPSERVAALTGDALTALLAEKEDQFDQRFKQTFAPAASHGDATGAANEAKAPVGSAGRAGAQPASKLSEAGGSMTAASTAADDMAVEMAKAALSNLLGSVGYWHGTTQVRLPDQPSTTRTSWPMPLFSAVPSRSLFPHGHLRDEGFHQLLVQRFDPQLSKDMLAHWLDAVNARGWIPRELVLGEEAHSLAPEESMVQDAKDSSPPTLFLPVAEMARQLLGQGGAREATQDDDQQSERTRQFLQAAWPRLTAWYHWLNTTQQGPLPTTYRWRGRNASTVLELNPRTVSSGLDDYPRASHPSADERHLDLRCWMAMAAETLVLVGEVLGLPREQTQPFQASWDALRDLEALRRLHQDPTTGHFLDYGLHSEDALLQRRSYPVEGQVQDITFRVVNTQPAAGFVPCFGYVSLFPLLLRQLPPDSDELGRQLKLLRDPQLLWTGYGLRSVSPKCSIYRKYNTALDPPYWRGHVSLNINYLAVSALQHYSRQPGPWAEDARVASAALKRAVLSTVANEFSGRGYLWEFYDDTTGRGLGSHPYAGWTALVALMLAA